MDEPSRDENTDSAGPSGAARGLHCLDGGLAPDWVPNDLGRLLVLPAAARARFWDALTPQLKVDPGRDAEARIERFCKAHEASRADVDRALRASRWLVQRAAARDLDRARFGEDLDTLGASPDAASVLLAGYDAGKAAARRDLARSAVVEHGPVVESVDWRVDVITASSRSSRLRAPVAVLTLRYRDGDRHDRLTVQLGPEAVRELKRLCDKMLA